MPLARGRARRGGGLGGPATRPAAVVGSAAVRVRSRSARGPPRLPHGQEVVNGVGARARGAGAARRRRRLAAAGRHAGHAGDAVRCLRACWSGPRCSTGSTCRARARPCASWRRRRLRWCSSATPRASTWVSCGVAPTCRCGCSASGCALTIVLGRRGRGRPLRRAERRRGRDPRDRPGADGCGAGTGGGHRAARAAEDPPGPQRRERAQRRDLRAAAVRGRCGRRRGVRDLRRPQPRQSCCSRRSATACWEEWWPGC